MMADRFFSLGAEEMNSLKNYDEMLCAQQSHEDMNNSIMCDKLCSNPVELNDSSNSAALSYLQSDQGYNSATVDVTSNQPPNGNYVGNQLFHPTTAPVPSLMKHPVHLSSVQCQYVNCNGAAGTTGCYNRNRYTPYTHNRACAMVAASVAASSTMLAPSSSTMNIENSIPTVNPLGIPYQQLSLIYQNAASGTPISQPSNCGLYDRMAGFDYSLAQAVVTSSAGNNTMPSAIANGTINVNSNPTSNGFAANGDKNGALSLMSDANQFVTLHIKNLDYSMDEASLRTFLLNQLKPITPVVSLVFEGSSYVKVVVPNSNFAKQVVANLHRKKIGHKRMIVSYTRDSSLTEFNTLRCQVAGLLKDVPYFTLPMYKFRELFQSRFKTSISMMDLYKMQDICNISADNNDEKFISLQPELYNSLESSPLMEGLQQSVPYCTIHFKREQSKGWAEQEIEPLPNVFMTITEIQQIIYPLLKSHSGDIPVASLVHCIEGELNIQIVKNDNGVNLEHLVCCVHGVQINTNSFGNKVLGLTESDNTNGKENPEGRFHAKSGYVADPLYQISREVVELIKMSPKSTMKFNRFIPAYHNHFGKQCRVADYGYTKLIELFEALSAVVQIMGDGENRQITLTHRIQVRRFTSDLLRLLRALGNKSVLLSQLPMTFYQIQHRNFDITDYGVCDIVDILDGLVNSNVVTVSTLHDGKDILISIPQRKQTTAEIEKTNVFAAEVVELFRNAPQYSILFQKFVRSYHYHFAYQCRLSDYGFFKLADLMEAIQGVVEMELTNDEDKKVFLSPKVAQRVFAEQLEELIREFTGTSKTCTKLDEVLELHKKKFGYNIQPQSLGVNEIEEVVHLLPYVEVLTDDNKVWIICHNDDAVFRTQCYRSCNLIRESGSDRMSLNDFIHSFSMKYQETLSESSMAAMKHAVEVFVENGSKIVQVSSFMKFLITIVEFVEHRTVLLADIKTSLNIECNMCFQYGFPNLFTVLRAYPDIFSLNMGTTQERSEVSLITHSELALHLNQHNNSLPNGAKNCSKPLLSKVRSSRLPLTENNRISLNKQLGAVQKLLPNKTQHNVFQKPVHSTAPVKIPECVQNIQNTSSKGNPLAYNYFNIPSTFNTSTTLNNAMYAAPVSYNNKENSIHNSTFNTSSNSSLNSLSDSNSSRGNMNCSDPTGYSKLWDRQQLSFYNNSGECYSNSDGYMFESVNQLQSCASCEAFEPEVASNGSVPFWLDPVWTNNTSEQAAKANALNIKLPDFKAFNILPMVLSPYTLSKLENSKRKIFDFKNPGRKIA